MRDQQRIDQMNEGAAFLRALPDTLTADDRARIANIALGMERFATLVLDRDAGPSRDAATEINRLASELTAANGVARELDLEYAAYREKTKPMRHENARLSDTIVGLQNELVAAKAPAVPLPTDQIPEQVAPVAGG